MLFGHSGQVYQSQQNCSQIRRSILLFHYRFISVKMHIVWDNTVKPLWKEDYIKKLSKSGIKNSHQPNNIFDKKEKNRYRANELIHFSILEKLCEQLHRLSWETEWDLQDKTDILQGLKGPATLSGLVFRVQEFTACPMSKLSGNIVAFLRELFVNCPQYDVRFLFLVWFFKS